MPPDSAYEDCFETVAALDIRKLPLRPADAFVLSRVDGKSNSKDIAHATALPEPQVARILDHLAELGAVRKARAMTASEPSPEPGSALPPKGPSAGQIAKIRALHALLGTGNHYQLLGVAATDGNARIKAAYHAYVGSLHPDRFFGVELGSLRPLLLEVFQRLTEAHKVLTRPASRARYDAMLEQAERER